jgi:hypothetical protein
VRNTLVAALVSSADNPYRSQARRFVQGLSSDELQFIAGFLGACVLDSTGRPCVSRAQWAERITRYQQASAGSHTCRSADQDHKMILLLEYLCRSATPREAPVIGQSTCPPVAPTGFHRMPPHIG